ncbi:hypothetical protein TP70_06785 [Staphylococcus microti]|uniref:UPF0349 protein NCTC13832_00585 n=1 Tax=Staphylococcus microti TaxID=569857 RepID=A0A0D6XQV4_9STAP|nr:YuzB family protein [Staphylococcus microti]KIX90621.1 hypothetical protein TP70_06785 [Staphylococcus microti]PNZ81480.1 DUF1450 domain-containing protein [Staphylococcus microti]SUM56922.1 putative DUF1450-containing protein [Staphylococcus microti]
MNPIVEFCISNLARGSQAVFEILDKDPNVDVLDYGCLQNCGVCSSGLYALVNGDLVEGNTSDELLQNIYAHIEETWLF